MKGICSKYFNKIWHFGVKKVKKLSVWNKNYNSYQKKMYLCILKIKLIYGTG